jgi:hypothetical protein
MSEERLPDEAGEHVWEHGWEDHRRQQQARLARLSPAEKLQWLEEAHRLVLNLQAAKKAAATPPPTDPSDSAPR